MWAATLLVTPKRGKTVCCGLPFETTTAEKSTANQTLRTTSPRSGALRRRELMPLAFGFSRSRLLNRCINHPTNPLLCLCLAFSSAASPSPSEPSPGGGGGPATIREGRAEIFSDESNSVFYNKAQVGVLDIFLVF